MRFASQVGAAAILVTTTLCLQSAGHGHSYPLGKSLYCARNPGTELLEFLRAYDPVHDCNDRFAPAADSDVGRVLSLALSSIMGVLLLFLGHELFDRWIWRCCSTASLAYPGSGRGLHWDADVWSVCERSVCHRPPAGRSRDPLLDADKNPCFRSSPFRSSIGEFF
jgi:hypothetical protein